MAQPTKQQIMNVFIELLNERSFEKITVTDIVERSKINRNTFYYYYDDIYDLLEELLSTEAQRIIVEHKKYDKWQDQLILATGFARLNKRAINHIYKSMDKELFEKYVHKIIAKPISDYIDIQATGVPCNELDKDVLKNFYTSAIVADLVHWVQKGMKRDFNDYISRLSILLEGSVQFQLKNRIDYDKLKKGN